MILKKAVLFVDANNWYHNVKKWFKPSDLDITKVAKMICFDNGLELSEVRWYTSMPSIQDDELVYKRQRAFLGSLERRGVRVITRKLQRLSNDELRTKRKELLDSWDLCNKCRPIVSESFMDISDHHQKEKGIDVWIAIDMVKESLQGNIDCCVLISGDADFVPALNLVKDVGKEVLVSAVPSGFSNELRQKFRFLVLGRKKLSACLRDYSEVSHNG